MQNSSDLTTNFFGRTSQPFAVRQKEKSFPLTILQRISNSDQSAVEDCIDAYGDLIWTLAKRFFPTEEVEEAVREVFLDVWKYAGRCDPVKTNETAFIKLIACRCLIKRSLYQSLQKTKKSGRE